MSDISKVHPDTIASAKDAQARVDTIIDLIDGHGKTYASLEVGEHLRNIDFYAVSAALRFLTKSAERAAKPAPAESEFFPSLAVVRPCDIPDPGLSRYETEQLILEVSRYRPPQWVVDAMHDDPVKQAQWVGSFERVRAALVPLPHYTSIDTTRHEG